MCYQAVLKEAEMLKTSGVHVITVGVGKWLDIYELNAISSYPYDVNTILLPDHERMSESTDQVLRLICNSMYNTIRSR